MKKHQDSNDYPLYLRKNGTKIAQIGTLATSREKLFLSICNVLGLKSVKLS